MKSGYYHHAIGDLRKRLTAAVPKEVLKTLHRKSPARHFAVVVRQALLLAAAFALGWSFDSLWVRVPCAGIARIAWGSVVVARFRLSKDRTISNRGALRVRRSVRGNAGV